MKIIKGDGRTVEYDAEKVKRSILRTGANSELIAKVMPQIEARLMDNMSTKELFQIVREEVEKESVCYSCRYNLREGILKLGPAGFKFEKYVASILRAYGWDATVPEDDLHGSCVDHEVDVVAEKDGRRIFIEAKFRNRYKDTVNLKDTMATWSRFLDLVDGAAIGKTAHLDEPWIVTNARFSDRARKFGVCKGIHMIGWNFPEERSFGEMVDHLSLYPITVLIKLKDSELEAFFKNDIMLCREVVEFEPEELSLKIGVSVERARELIKLSNEVLGVKS